MNHSVLCSRRRIIKRFMLLSASSILFGKKWLANVVAQVGPPAAQTGGVLRLKLSDFPALSQSGGSVRIGTSGLQALSAVCDVPIGLYSPVIINRGAGNQFYALNSACTHAGCTVPIYNPSLGYSQCPHQGSRFGIDGSLKRGPAGAPLESYSVRFDGVDTLTVNIPEMSFELVTASVQYGERSRLSLTFLAFSGIEYEVHVRPLLTDNWAGVPFSLTPDGPTDQSYIDGISDYATVYVDQTNAAGFYAVVMRTQEV